MTTATSTVVAGSLAAGTRLHEYEIQQVLGHGGFGITYLARDTHLDKVVAIKEYLPADLAVRTDANSVTVRAQDSREAFDWGREQFLKEARVLARFSHPNLIAVHRFFEANNTAYFVMEYAEGTTLDHLLKKQGALPEESLRRVLDPILVGLDQVHRAGVLHRDIKPGNIILRANGQPVLIDFGAARQNLSSATRSIMSVLTAGYAPIEQYSTSSGQGPWTDLYALGAVAYRMLSGRKPVDSIARVREDPLVPASMIGQGRYAPHFLAAVDWALAVDADDRPKSIAEWRLALDGKTTPPVRKPHSFPLPVPSAAPAGDATEIMPHIAPLSAEATVAMTRVLAQEAETQIVPAPLGTAAASSKKYPVLLWGGLAATVVLLASLAFFLGARRASAPEPAAPVVEIKPAPAAAVSAPPVSKPVEIAVETAAIPPPVTEPLPAPADTAAAPAPEIKSAPGKKTPAVKSEKKSKPAPPPAAAKGPQAVAAMSARSSFQDCPQCPVMVALPAGHYEMGAAPGPGTNRWEGPQHPVSLRKAFAIGKLEVSKAEWQACVNGRGCTEAAGGAGKAAYPVIQVHWTDATRYAVWLSKQTGRNYRLPTEAEWEYAARAGTTTARYWGEDRSRQCEFANGADVSGAKIVGQTTRTAECDDRFALLAPVGSFKPNGYGLFDMAGNVWEWTQDCWRDSYAGAPSDGRAVDGGCGQRVIRGGSWRTKPESLRSAGRGLGTTDQRGDDLGFRVAVD